MEKTYYDAYCQLCVNTASADMDTATRLEDSQGPEHGGPQQSLGGEGAWRDHTPGPTQDFLPWPPPRSQHSKGKQWGC